MGPSSPTSTPPAAPPGVSYVLYTDVASAIPTGQLPDALFRRLAGQRLAITFVTVGELTQWT